MAQKLFRTHLRQTTRLLHWISVEIRLVVCFRNFAFRLTGRDSFCAADTIGDDGARAIADALKTNKTLTTLELGGTFSPPFLFC